MAKPKLKRQEPTTVAKGAKVRGRPITEVSRDALEAEIAKLQQSVRNLEDTLRLRNEMWHRALITGEVSEDDMPKRRLHS